ncbi:hypothetical protein E2554_10445 [Staphylococcus petrasii]|uniref:hypothetical protein n=1 Tax=Staphylococcus petrasii TaxID=1276936 RepID=UPI00107EC4BD|nr:hypothetical protein E2554_10445 [Staphylococcus petrasii]
MKEVYGELSKSYTLRVYSVRTPKYKNMKDIERNDKGKVIKNHFEINVIDEFFKVLKIIPEKYHNIYVELPHIDETCKMTFIDYEIYNNEYSIVTLETDKFGEIKDIKNNIDNTKNKQLDKHESVPETVQIVITRQHGMMYVTRDNNTIINKTTINTFFNKYRFVLYEYIKKWNQANKEIGLKIYRQPAIKVDSLPSTDFFDELDKLINIDEFAYTYDPSGANDTPGFEDVEIFADTDLQRKNFKETKKFKTKVEKAIVKEVKKIYENLSNKGNYDEWYVKGENQNHKTMVVKPELATRSEHIQLNNVNQININELINKISDILKENNPFLARVPKLVDIIEVSIDTTDTDVIERIKEKFQEKFEEKKIGSEDDENRNQKLNTIN